ncbi:MAG TPA: 2OG-Fe(II) oxygenase [Caulobacteraceae bacterium]|nr:2OG-Fe(II) oxygenase [Caulobacteraceae bacterium]
MDARMVVDSVQPQEAEAAGRLDSLDWEAIEGALFDQGHARIPGLLGARTCEDLAALYDDDQLFRSRIVMAKHAYGSGEYRYFADPLPPVVAALRESLYARLAPVGDRWNEAMRIKRRYPADLAAFRTQCHASGQTRPTPLLLRYREGDYNRLHQDIYGEHVFPLQVVALLSQPGKDFTGGELVLTEQRARMQSRAEVVDLGQGDAVIFAVRERPVAGARGMSRAILRHGVSRVRSGLRHTLGVIFHDAA